MRFPYHDALPQQFEDLVTELCIELLGDGVHGFSSGPDEGRDARFSGTAKRFPNQEEPYRGNFVIQAKHTENPIAKFSDQEFMGYRQDAIVNKEIPKIRRLVMLGECDHYFLFSNRRLAGKTERSLRQYIREETQVQTVELFGIERIDNTVKRYPDAMDRAGLSELKLPLQVSPDDLAIVICELDEKKVIFQEAMENVSDRDNPKRLSFEKKNAANRLNHEFAEYLKENYMRYFSTVRSFLVHPENEEILKRYNEAKLEFQEQIIVHQGNEQPMEEVLLNIQCLLWNRDSDLYRRKNLVKLILYYMYWNCDIGRNV